MIPSMIEDSDGLEHREEENVSEGPQNEEG